MEGLIENQRHKLIIEKGKEFLKVAFDSDKEGVKKIIATSKNCLTKFNKKEFTIVDLTEVEKRRFITSTKRIIVGQFVNSKARELGKKISEYKTCKDCEKHKEHSLWLGVKEWHVDYDKLCVKCQNYFYGIDRKIKLTNNLVDKIEQEFLDACLKTVFSSDLRNRYVMYKRMKINNGGYYKSNFLDRAIADSLKIEVMSVFQEQNKQLITKYI